MNNKNLRLQFLFFFFSFTIRVKSFFFYLHPSQFFCIYKQLDFYFQDYMAIRKLRSNFFAFFTYV
ncbi:hypothetical protein RhiirA5_89504 [Rhizophagus irregularis]|uniref:Uncharacterized protein n=1 Tax=Rhizophagus irregularis TaxID=588596 RepID=A0A2N0NX88_9GLOM|nr:hypothetical protein RhiirA5_89504 [Rhizophagus irregularis]GET59007.1 hypothetical protein RIR_e40523_A0A2N0NX88_9GLOM [Rhizophagus irregularis DAOM 181602=DAOM 197198]